MLGKRHQDRMERHLHGDRSVARPAGRSARTWGSRRVRSSFCQSPMRDPPGSASLFTPILELSLPLASTLTRSLSATKTKARPIRGCIGSCDARYIGHTPAADGSRSQYEGPSLSHLGSCRGSAGVTTDVDGTQELARDNEHYRVLPTEAMPADFCRFHTCRLRRGGGRQLGPPDPGA